MAIEPAERNYNSPLRAEQLEQTQQRILRATADVLSDETVDDVTVPVIAKRARVSLRTVYRHFPTKEALFDAFGEWAEQNLQLILRSYPDTLDELREFAPALYHMYDEHQWLVRAIASKQSLKDIRSRERERRKSRFEKAMRDLTDDLEPAARRRALAIVYLLVSAPAWQAMHEQWGLDGKEAGRAAAWAVRVLTDELRRNPESINKES